MFRFKSSLVLTSTLRHFFLVCYCNCAQVAWNIYNSPLGYRFKNILSPRRSHTALQCLLCLTLFNRCKLVILYISATLSSRLKTYLGYFLVTQLYLLICFVYQVYFLFKTVLFSQISIWKLNMCIAEGMFFL